MQKVKPEDIPREAAGLGKVLKIDNIIVHVHTDGSSIREGDLMKKEGEGIIVKMTRPGVSQRA